MACPSKDFGFSALQSNGSVSSWKKEIQLSKGYWVSAYCETKDQAKLATYAQLAVPAVEAAGGKVVVRGVTEEVRE